jgi:hypothetical protein
VYRFAALFLGSLSVASAAATGTAPVAYVYVSTSKGINLYDVASTGKLTLVSGSPFQDHRSHDREQWKILRHFRH